MVAVDVEKRVRFWQLLRIFLQSFYTLFVADNVALLLIEALILLQYGVEGFCCVFFYVKRKER